MSTCLRRSPYFLANACVMFAFVASTSSVPVFADVMPSGHKSVSHKLVFDASDLLSQHRLVAAPIAGFHGEVEIVAGQPFDFSSKYGTRIYLLPDSIGQTPEFDKTVYSNWPSVRPPKSEIRSVPMSNPVASALSTIRLVGFEGAEPQLKLVSHVEYDSSGNVVTDFGKQFWLISIWLIPAGSIFAGIFVCSLVYLRLRQKATAHSNE